jgi:hypothetical protein
VSSVVLFFLSFGIGFREKSRLTASLFMSGGALGGSKLVEPSIGLNLYLVIALPYLYKSLIAIGFILIGLAVFRVVKRIYSIDDTLALRDHVDYNKTKI